jgi:large subunit ribosomal protein L32e
MSDHLKIRAIAKRKKPRFIRQDAHKCMRIKSLWRRPKGITNKIRLQRRGYRRRPETGWGSPTDIKYKSQEGHNIILVATVLEAQALKPKKDAAIIARTGAKKKLAIIEVLTKNNITILNVNAELFKKVVTAKLAEKQAAKEEKDKKKEKKTLDEKAKSDSTKKKDAEKKKEDVASEDTSLNASDDSTSQDEPLDEGKKKKEKEDKDKLLTKRT